MVGKIKVKQQKIVKAARYLNVNEIDSSMVIESLNIADPAFLLSVGRTRYPFQDDQGSVL